MAKSKRKLRTKSSAVSNDLAWQFGDLVTPKTDYAQSHTDAYNPHAALKRFTDWCYQAAQINARKCGATPLRLYARKKSGIKLYRTSGLTYRQRKNLNNASRTVRRKTMDWQSEMEVVTERHPVIEFLEKEGFYKTVSRWIYIQIFGNAYECITERQFEMPSKSVLIPSQYVLPVLSKSQLGVIEKYKYTGCSPAMDIPVEDMLHYKLPCDLVHPEVGMGRMQAVWSALLLKSNKREMQVSLSWRQIYPYLIFLLQKADQAAINRFETDIANKLLGPGKAGKSLALPADKAQVITPDLPQFEFGDDAAIVSEIGAGFGVPENLLQMKSSTEASAKVAMSFWLEDTIHPMLRYDEEYLNTALLPQFGMDADDYCLAYDHVGEDDDEDQRAMNLFKSGIIRRNRALEMIGEPKLPEGDPEGEAYFKNDSKNDNGDSNAASTTAE